MSSPVRRSAVVTSPDDRGRWSREDIALTAATTFAVAAISMCQTLSIPLLPELTRTFGTDAASVSWVATGALVASAVVNPIVGRMGDMYGKRPIVFASLAIALLGSILGAVSGSLGLLIVARVVQGAGSGLIPLVFGILRDQLPNRRTAAASSVVMLGGVGIGAGLGPISMGVIVDRWGVDAAFWVAASVFAVAIALMAKYSRPSTVRFPATFDIAGTVALSFTLVMILLGITKGAQWGWTSSTVIGLFIGGVACGGWWIRWEGRVPEPVVDLAAIRRPQVLVAHLGGLVAGFSSFSQYIVVFTLVALPSESGHGLGRTVSVAGLVQLPGVVVLSASILIAARATARHGPNAVLVAGASVVAAGFALGALRHGSILDLAISVVVVNIGLGPLFSTLPILILGAVDPGEMSSVNAVNALSRLIGSVLASALAGTILASGVIAIGGIEYPAAWTFVAVYLLAAVAATGLAGAAARIRQVERRLVGGIRSAAVVDHSS